MAEGGWRPRPQETKSAPNYVIDQIREALFSRELKPGDRLPSETELGNMFSVSRGSVRQAMKSLESLGVVSIRPGDGTYVNDILSENSFNPLAFALLISTPTSKTLADARYALERDIFELILEDDECVEKVIPKLEQNLREREEMLNKNESVQKLIENDQEFHKILSRSCGNLLLQIVYDYVVDSFKQYLVFTTKKIKPGEEDPSMRDHKAILEALRHHSFSEAKEATKNSMKAWSAAVEGNYF